MSEKIAELKSSDRRFQSTSIESGFQAGSDSDEVAPSRRNWWDGAPRNALPREATRMIWQSSPHDEARSDSPVCGRKQSRLLSPDRRAGESERSSLEIDQLIGSTQADIANAASSTVAIAVARHSIRW